MEFISTSLGSEQGKKNFLEETGNENTIYSHNVSLSSQEKLSLSSWGLPSKVLDFYKSKGITSMFQWQLECLTNGRVLDAGNLVYSAPTSAGKTLVAEILISKTLFEVQKKAIVILPFVSVVREKMFYFQNMYNSSGIHVEGYMGGHSPSICFKQVHVAVCTIEKANTIINRLLEEQGLENLGLVVVDELHLLGDPYRGYLLELLLTKLKYISQKMNFKIQILGMSATLPNLKSLANWLQADLFYTEFRPVPLNEKLKCGTEFYDKQLNKLSDLTPLASEASDDSENVGQLCVETIANGHSVLIFCPTKVWCENLADKISLFFKRNGCDKSAEIEGTPGWILRKQLNLKKINEVLEHLKMCPVGLDQNLKKTVAYGVAFHHAGLTLDERDIIEGSFRQGSIRVLCATSTLSSGVNLPARKVIIRSPMSFGGLMDILTYRQMIGRAGRMGVDTEGESILICKPNEKNLCQTLMCSTLKPIQSCLGHGRLSASLKRALLEVIASGIASSPEEVEKYARCTFLAFSSKHDIQDPIKSCIEFLEDNEFIRLQESGTIYTPTPLGKACLASSLPPDEGLALFRELQRARRCFVLDTDLHIIYQVTPYSVSEQWSKVDWLNVLNILESLPPSMKRVGEMVGVEEAFLIRVAKGMVNLSITENRNKLSIHRRFYTSLALQDLVNEIPLSEVAEKYECNKGMLQSLQQSAATYAGMVTEFTKCLGWSSVELIFSQFQERLQFGIQRELCELMRLPLLNAMRARVLFNAGFTSLSAIANANIVDIENVFFAMAPFQTKKEIAGETTYDRDQRTKVETIWITGKADLSIRDAAELLLIEARNILQIELGLECVKWGKRDTSMSESLCKIQDKTSSSVVLNNKIEDAKFNESSQRNTSPPPTGTQIMHENDSASKEVLNSPVIDNVHVSEERICDKNLINESIKKEDNECEIKSKEEGEELENFNAIKRMNNEHNDKELLNERVSFSDSQIKHNVQKFEYNINQCSTTKEKSFILQKEEFNFTSSSIFEMIPDYITERQEDEENVNHISNYHINQIKDSDSILSDPESVDSVEMLYESKIQSDSKVLSFSRLSEDMFDKDNDNGKIMSTPIQAHASKKALNTEVNKGNGTEISSPDLFSQSLTFDTQLGRILNFEEPPVRMAVNRNVENPSSSFNSDDLGFVSDLSPPNPNLKQSQKLCLNNKNMKLNLEVQDAGRSESTLENGFMSPANDFARNAGVEKNEALKRKADRIDSPDLIVDSDESVLQSQHMNKRIKYNELEKNHTLTSPVIVNESDDEIMPTPKFDKMQLSNTSNIKKLRSGYVKSLNQTMAKRNTRRSTSISQNVSRLKKKFINPKKTKNETLTTPTKRRKMPIITHCRSDKLRVDKINIIDVCEKEEKYEVFCDKLKEQNVVSMALGCRRKIVEKKNLIGSKIMRKRKIENVKINDSPFQYKEIILDGIAFYWEGNDVSYLSLDDRIVPVVDKLDLIKSLCHKKKTLRIFDVKEQMKMLKRCCSVLLTCSCQDPRVGYWLLSENHKEKNFSSIVLEYLPGFKNLLSEIGSVVGYSSPGLNGRSATSHKIRASIEAFLIYHLIEQQLPLLHEKGLEQAFVQTEMPVMLYLSEMELSGFQICRKKILSVKENLEAAIEALQERAYALAGHKFSLQSSVAIGKVLFKELNLETENVILTKKKKLVSTNKQALQELADETKHPLPLVILQWRKIRSVLTKFVSYLLQVSLESTRVFGVCNTHTVTGRICMHEPNLQNIPKNFDIEYGNDVAISVNIRDAFIASDNCLLVSADYCQIELRVLAHLAEDADLIKNIKESPDIFISIAANIFGVPHYEVDDTLRNRTKQICYGMIYGIGPKALSQQLGIEEADAVVLMENFKNKYTGVKTYIERTIKECRKKGFVTTLLGRRRYLPGVNDINQAVRTEAERQAINTTIQGSAADLVKTAMIIWREKVDDLILNGIVIHPVLHLHDELIFDVQRDFVEAVSVILKETMESAMELLVPIPVKVKIGSSWGQLKNFEF